MTNRSNVSAAQVLRSLMSDEDEPPVLSYSNRAAEPPKPAKRADIGLLIGAALTICLPPISLLLSMMSIIRGIDVINAGPHGDASSGWILILGGVMVLLVSCGLIVLFARDML
jgi:hypothetical protein